MRRSHLLLITLLLGLALLPFPQTAASASCAAPYLNITDRLVLEQGATATIEGRSFVEGCRDSMSCTTGLGCDYCTYDNPPPRPLKDVEPRLAQHDRTWSLDVADAQTAENDHLGWVTWTFDLPAEVKPGAAKLLAEHSHPVRMRIR